MCPYHDNQCDCPNLSVAVSRGLSDWLGRGGSALMTGVYLYYLAFAVGAGVWWLFGMDPIVWVGTAVLGGFMLFAAYGFVVAPFKLWQDYRRNHS
jgi:hypothetical protein